ncbi:MAG: ribonuclease HII [Candidatus Saccharibacteria bacterium]
MISVGIDEVGRGCWAGPLVAGAVILPDLEVGPIDSLLKLRDSKKLSKKQRSRLDAAIRDQASAIGLGWVTPKEIDDVGLSAAVKLAMERAFAEIAIGYDEIIIDGNINYFAGNPKAQAVIRADDRVPSVSAASIVAKVARDKYMSELQGKYAGYGFETHVGYGTAAHIAALKRLGVSDIHRRSYKPIKAFLA